MKVNLKEAAINASNLQIELWKNFLMMLEKSNENDERMLDLEIREYFENNVEAIHALSWMKACMRKIEYGEEND